MNVSIRVVALVALLCACGEEFTSGSQKLKANDAGEAGADDSAAGDGGSSSSSSGGTASRTSRGGSSSSGAAGELGGSSSSGAAGAGELGGTGGSSSSGAAGVGGTTPRPDLTCENPYSFDDPKCDQVCAAFPDGGLCYGEGRDVCACPNVSCNPCQADSCPRGMQCAAGGCFPPGDLLAGESCTGSAGPTLCGPGLHCGNDLHCEAACP